MEAKANKWTNNNTCANKQTNWGSMCAGGGAELCGDGVWHAMHQSMWKGFRDVLEIHQKSMEVDNAGLYSDKDMAHP